MIIAETCQSKDLGLSSLPQEQPVRLHSRELDGQSHFGVVFVRYQLLVELHVPVALKSQLNLFKKKTPLTKQIHWP